MLHFHFEAFLVEVGLCGNPFSWDYGKMGGLATRGTWFQNTWEMVWLLGIRVELHDQFHLQPVREGDSSLMRLFYEAGFTGKQVLEVLNIVRRFKNVLNLSDLLLCNGKTIDWSFALSREYGPSIGHRFPKEMHKGSDLAQWEIALRSLAGGRSGMRTQLGPFLRKPHPQYD